jgi:hypothetical protein
VLGCAAAAPPDDDEVWHVVLFFLGSFRAYNASNYS